MSVPEHAGGAYEFSVKESRIIRDLAWCMLIVGMVLLAVGVFLLVQVTLHGLVTLVIGGFTLRAGWAFLRVVRTQGDDRRQLMRALQSPSLLYYLQVILLGISLAALVAVIVLGWAQRG